MIVYLVPLILCAVVSVILGWHYWDCKRKYGAFPSFSLTFHLLYLLFTGQIPKDRPFTAFIFQEMIKVCKTKKEGICLFWFLEPILFVYNEEAIKILTHEQAAIDKPKHYRALEVGFGKGLITSNGKVWKHHRKLINPVFNIGMLRDKISIFNENASILVRMLMEKDNQPTQDMFYILRYCSFSIFSESILGIEILKKENLIQMQRMACLIDKLAEFAVYKMVIPMYNWKYIMNIFPYVRQNMEYHKEIYSFSQEILCELKEKVRSTKVTNNTTEKDTFFGKSHKSFAEILLELHLQDPTFTMNDVQDQVNTFTVAGFDTISYTLMWCLFLMGMHPEVQEQAYHEISSLTITDMKYEDLHTLTYLDCILKESLRIYPTIPLYARQLTKDVQCGKYMVPKDTIVAMFTYMWHRDPTIYPDPEKFDPDRFLDTNSEKHSWMHIPFAEGIRSCIGKNYAMLEMKVILAHILQNFKVTTLDRREDVDVAWQIALAPTKPINMKFTPRHPHVQT